MAEKITYGTLAEMFTLSQRMNYLMVHEKNQQGRVFQTEEGLWVGEYGSLWTVPMQQAFKTRAEARAWLMERLDIPR